MGPKFSTQTIDKARQAIQASQLREVPGFPGLWMVKDYRVQVSRDETGQVAYVTCTCPNGMHNDPMHTTCYHAAAVMMTMTWRAGVR